MNIVKITFNLDSGDSTFVKEVLKAGNGNFIQVEIKKDGFDVSQSNYTNSKMIFGESNTEYPMRASGSVFEVEVPDEMDTIPGFVTFFIQLTNKNNGDVLLREYTIRNFYMDEETYSLLKARPELLNVSEMPVFQSTNSIQHNQLGGLNTDGQFHVPKEVVWQGIEEYGWVLTYNDGGDFLQFIRGIEGETIQSDFVVAIGFGAGANGPQPKTPQNTSVGANSNRFISGQKNTAIGLQSLFALTQDTDAEYNTALGHYALFGIEPDCDKNTALGSESMITLPTGTTNSTGVGYGAQVTGSNQVQLGDSLTTPYAFNALQLRSDERDKTDVHDLDVGLDFINKVRPKKYKFNFREDYIVKVLKTDTFNKSDYNIFKEIYEDEYLFIFEMQNDGSKKRKRWHYGVIAQQIGELIENGEQDFGGYQDHSVNGGKDVMSIGYEEFIAPLIKSVQELSAENNELKAQLALIKAHIGL